MSMCANRAVKKLSSINPRLCRFCSWTATKRRITEDEGDWSYSSEWWGTHSSGHPVLRSLSSKGNGVVSVLSFPSSRPCRDEWAERERWMQKRFAKIHGDGSGGCFQVLGYQWRTLHFNDTTRQSTVKVMAAYHDLGPGSIFLMQQPHCLAVPYVKSMVSAGLATIASCNYDFAGAVSGKSMLRVLCIGHGGGSLPLFLAAKIQGAIIDVVEIDSLVISASIGAMGFPAFTVMSSLDQRAMSKPRTMDEVLWKGIHERIYLYESDAVKFIRTTSTVYDMIFIDAYDGEDIFPRHLWDPDFPFLKALSNQLHPVRGTVVVNLHSGDDFSTDRSVAYFNPEVHPITRHVPKVCRAYMEVLLRNKNSEGAGLAFTVTVPWVCNTSLVVSRGLNTDDSRRSRELAVLNIADKCLEVENIMNLPFSCLQFIKRGLTLFA